MYEIFPIAAGVITGLGVMRIEPIRLRTIILAVMSVLLGVVATVVSGEALLSWAFVLIDIPLVFVSAVMAIGVSLDWQRRANMRLP